MVVKMELQPGSLEEKALERKERLKALKRKHTEETNENGDKESSDKAVVLPKPKFRSYKPQDDKLQEHLLPAAKPGDVTKEIGDQLQAAKNSIVIDELDITNLAPRKPDWDLKRDVAKKLEKLERRTQKAIAELIRERLKQGQQNLADAVNASVSISQDNKST